MVAASEYVAIFGWDQKVCSFESFKHISYLEKYYLIILAM